MRKVRTKLVGSLLIMGVTCAMFGGLPSANAAERRPLNAVADTVQYHVLFPPHGEPRVTVRDGLNGTAVAGLFISFSGITASSVQCTATTNQEGVATCTVSLTNPLLIADALLTGYKAVFTGNAKYAPFEAKGGAQIGL